jgi:hypothetical protein
MANPDMYVETKIILECAENLISRPRRWTRDAFARAGDGHEVHYLDPDARRWSMAGAVLRAGAVLAARAFPPDRDAWYDAARDALVELARVAGADVATFRDHGDAIRALFAYNDAHGRRAVLALFEHARQAIDARL